MSEELEATQGLPEGEAAAEKPADQQVPESGTEQSAEQSDQEAEKPKHKPWFQERIDQLTREKYDERRQREALENVVAELRKGGSADESKAPPDVDRLANERAEQMVKARQFDEKCNEVFSSGKSEYQDFEQSLGNFRMLGGIPPAVLEAATQIPDAHRVLYALGNDMDNAARIFSLPPVPMALELAKLSVSPTKSRPISSAPPPIRPIDGLPKGDPDPSKMSTDDWIKWREAEVEKRR